MEEVGGNGVVRDRYLYSRQIFNAEKTLLAVVGVSKQGEVNGNPK